LNDGAPSPKHFYTETVPEQWNRALHEQERAVEAAQRTLDAMRAVNATIRVVVSGAEGGTFHMNVEGGRMHAGESPAREPFLTVVQDRPAFERLAREAGDSALALLGGLSGLSGEMKLTAGRLRNLMALKGTLRFEVTGPEGFTLLTHFGPDPIADEPDTSISVSPEAYQDLRSGRLEPQNAFMSGQIQVAGDMQLAMQLALAALSPD